MFTPNIGSSNNSIDFDQFVDSGKKDCLINIFKQFSLLRDIGSCACVSKEWNTAASDDTLWMFFISKTFPSASNAFLRDAQYSSQKEIFKYSHHLANRFFTEEMFPESGSFYPLQQNGKKFLISESGAIYVWNRETQTLDLIKKLWELPQSNEYPHNVYKLSLCTKKVLNVTKDTFAVLCEKSGYEIKEIWGRSPKAKKAKGSLLKIFNDTYKEIKEIPFDSKMKDIRVTDNDQFIGITDSNVLVNITEKFVQTHKFTNENKIKIISLNHGKCWVSGLGHESYEDKYTLSLFDIVQGTKLLREIISYSRPKIPFNSDRFIFLPSEENCQILDLDQEFNAPMAEIPFGKDSFELASFNAQGKLLLSDMEFPPKTALLDPENEWKQVQTEVKFSCKQAEIDDPYNFILCYDDQTFRFYAVTGSINSLEVNKVVGDGMLLRGEKLINCDPSNKKIVLQLANETDLIRKGAIDGFEKLPKRVRNAIYGEMYRILDEKGKLSSVKRYWGMGEALFHGNGAMAGIATSSEKIQAMKCAADIV